MDISVLQKKKEEIQLKFNALDKQRIELENQAKQTLDEEMRMQGEFRLLDNLIKENTPEPTVKEGEVV